MSTAWDAASWSLTTQRIAYVCVPLHRRRRHQGPPMLSTKMLVELLLAENTVILHYWRFVYNFAAEYSSYPHHQPSAKLDTGGGNGTKQCNAGTQF